MTPESQRIAIAEACGWKHISGERWVRKGEEHVFGYSPPHYSSDLNAMHEAEGTLSDKEQMADYFIRISESHGSEYGLEGFDAIHATAAQRAEAFLRTIGKWEDDK